MAVCYDGMMSDKYKTAPVKIVWVLKEALYEGNLSEQLENAINRPLYSPTWLTMAYSAYAVINGWGTGAFTGWKDVPTLDNGVLEILRQVAVVNVKKEACTAKNGSSKNLEIKNAYCKGQEAINRQITGLDPDIVVFGYPNALYCIVEGIFKTQTGEDIYRTDARVGDFSVTTAEIRGKRRLFLWGYHPGYYRSEEKGDHSQLKYFTAFVDAVKDFRQNQK